jgi:hypothetical protein
MADDVTITSGANSTPPDGTVIATDQVGTDHVQIVKLADGTADSATRIAAGIGAAANAIRTAPANDITDATYIGDIKFGEALPTGANAIGKLAANSGIDIGDVDVASISAGTNVIGKVRLVTASGDEITEDTDDSIQVTIVADDVSLATSAGQLADGHNVTIDNVITDEVYVRGSGTAGTADAAVLTVQGVASMTPLAVTESSPIAGFATSAAQLADGHNVTIDNGAAGSAVNIQDGGNTITVDGTVTANAGTNLNTSALATSAGQLAAGHDVTIDNAGGGSAVNIQDGGNAITIDGTVTASNTAGDIAHDAGDSGNPVKVG